MVNKSKRRSRKSNKKIKRSIRHRIIKQSINPNLSIRSNVLNQNQPQTVGNSVRSRIMQNLQNPLLPITFSQTPPNVNLDAINNMRNQNDTRQQQVNDAKRDLADEQTRKKQLDEQQSKTEKELKKLKKANEELAEKNKKTEAELEEANSLSEKLFEMNKKHAQLDNTYNLKELQNKRDTLKVAIAEMEYNIQQQQAEIDQNQIRKEIESLTEKNKMLDARKREVQEMAKKYAGNVGLSQLVKAQHENNLKKYHTGIAEKRLKILEENYNMQIQLQAALSQKDMNDLAEEEKTKLQEAVQENIKLQQDLRDMELANRSYEEQYNILQQEKINTVRLQAEYEKASQIKKYQDNHKLDENIKNTIIANAQKKKEIEHMNMLEKSRDKLIQSKYELEGAKTAADYYTTQQSIDKYNQLVQVEKETNDKLKQADDYNDLAKAKKELRKSEIELEKSKDLAEKNTASHVAQIAYHTKKMAEAEDNLANVITTEQNISDSIKARISQIPPEVLQQFYDENPKYSIANSEDPALLDLRFLQEMDRDLTAFINKIGTNI